MKTLLDTLAYHFPPQNILRDPEMMAPYCTDERQRYLHQALAVVIPNTVEEVQVVVKFCAANQLFIVPQGGNTGLCGGAAVNPSLAHKSIILSLKKLNNIRAVLLDDGAIICDAGVVLADVQIAAERVGRFFPLSLASETSCQIGGNIACNAGGLNVVGYGVMRQLVMGLEVVTASGDVISTLSPVHKNTTGYDFTSAFIGSEGTLGIITAATLKLLAPPRSRATAWLGMANIDEAVQLLTHFKCGRAGSVSSFEIMSEKTLSLVEQHLNVKAPIKSPWHVLLELQSSLENIDLGQSLAHHLPQKWHETTVLANNSRDEKHFWQLRESIPAAQKRAGVSIKHDIALPISRLAGSLDRIERAIKAKYNQAHVMTFGHLGDGSLHLNVYFDNIAGNEVYHFENDVNCLVYKEVLAAGGTIAAEHGIGQLKAHWLPKIHATAHIALMKAMKSTLDPDGIMNPGKIFANDLE